MPLINDAENIFLGNTPVNAVYARNTKIWPTAVEVPQYIPFGPVWSATDKGQPPLQMVALNPPTGWSYSWNGTKIVAVSPSVPYHYDFGTKVWQYYIQLAWPSTVPVQHSVRDIVPADYRGLYRTRHCEITGFDIGGGRNIDSTLSWNQSSASTVYEGGFNEYNDGPLDDLPWINDEFVLQLMPPLTTPAGSAIVDGYWSWQFTVEWKNELPQPNGGTITIDMARQQFQFGIRNPEWTP